MLAKPAAMSSEVVLSTPHFVDVKGVDRGGGG